MQHSQSNQAHNYTKLMRKCGRDALGLRSQIGVERNKAVAENVDVGKSRRGRRRWRRRRESADDEQAAHDK